MRCAEIGFSQAAERKDAEAFAAFVDPEARFVAGEPARGRAAVVASWAALLTPGGTGHHLAPGCRGGFARR